MEKIYLDVHVFGLLIELGEQALVDFQGEI